MSFLKQILFSAFLIVLIAGCVGVTPSSTVRAQSGCAGVPFTDVSDFCFEIRIAYYAGITAGTSPTTFSPSDPTTRETAVAFTAHALNAALYRSNPRSAVGFLWAPLAGAGIATVGTSPTGMVSDGVDLWIVDGAAQKLFRVSHNGALLGTWTGLSGASDVLAVPGHIIVSGASNNIYVVDPSGTPGSVSPSTATTNAGGAGLAFDGQHIWRPEPNASTVSLLNPDGSYMAEFGPMPTPARGVFFDGTWVWLVAGDSTVRRINPSTFVSSDVELGVAFSSTIRPGFDGENLWVPDPDTNQVFIVRPSSQAVIATLTGNGLNGPIAVAFDGLHMLVANKSGNSVSVFQASDLTPLGSVALSSGTSPSQAASDGVNFFVIGSGNGQLWKF